MCVMVHCRTLAALDLSQACREVIDKDANAVLDEVEAAIYLVASTILRGEGFAYDIPLASKREPGQKQRSLQSGLFAMLAGCLEGQNMMAKLVMLTAACLEWTG